MKKSKFLKKSLAMLLALMLVVAMIPLSASAAVPTLEEAYATFVGASSQRLTVGDGTITGSIPETATQVGLRVLVTEGNGEVWYYDQTEDATKEKKATYTGSNGIWEISNLNVKDYEDENGDIVVKLFVKNSEDVTNYTATLTPVANATDTTIKTFTVWDNNLVPQLGETKIDLENYVIEITVPYDSQELKVRDIEVAEGAVATLNGVEVTRGTVVKDKDEIQVTAGGKKTTYTLKITRASGFKTFTTKEGLDAVMFPNENAIAVLLPHGYANDMADSKGNIQVTPVFELDYPSAVAYDEDNNKLTSGETAISQPAAQVITNGFSDFLGDGENSWAERKATKETWADFGANYVKNSGKNDSHKINIDYVEGTDRIYDVYFFEVNNNNEALITELTIGSETATIDQEAKTIDITLPAGVNKASIDVKNEPTKLAVSGSNNATIVLPMQTGVTLTDSALGDRQIETSFAVGGNANLNASGPVTIRVTSQDKLTVNDYTLNVTVSDNYQKPAINTMTLKAPNGTEYEGVLQGKTFVFEVPYSVKAKTNLADWKLFYTKTVGASATFNNGTAMPKTGAALAGDEDFIPVPGSTKNGADIVVTSVNPATESEEKDVYNIRINRAESSEVSTLESFGLYSDDFFTVKGYTTDGVFETVKDKKSIVVDLPWSVYQHVSFLQKLSASFEATDANSRVYYLDTVSGSLKELIEYENEEKLTATPLDGQNRTTKSGTPITIVVLSERMWVNEDDGHGTVANWATVKAKTENVSKYTEYPLYVDQADAQTKKDLNSITLIDGTGWTADLSVDVSNDTISGTVPYALTSETNENPVYLSYDVANRAWVLANDKIYDSKDSSGKPTKVNVTDENLPTSTTETSADPTNPIYFSDRYDEENDRYITDLSLIISRDGEVTVYYGGKAAQGVNSDKLVVTNENGESGFDTYTFKLKVAEPNGDAYFESFSLNGSKGVIDNTNHTIEVTLPYGTEYTYLKPVFTTSSGAVVKVDDPKVNGYLKSGVTDVNFSTKRQFVVIAEDEKHTTTYDVTVKVSDQFTDVNPGDWFYENVMGATQKGYVNGLGNGLFGPYQSTTRAQFASMIANVMGYVDDPDAESRFTDVPDDHWGKGAITFCYDNNIISGYDDGTFQPDKAVTREEAASIMKNAFKLTGTTTDKFTDDGKISNWAKDAVYACKATNIMKGDVSGSFRPNDTIIRAEAASILMNADSEGLIK